MNRPTTLSRMGRIPLSVIIAGAFVLITSVAGAAGLAWWTTRSEARRHQPTTPEATRPGPELVLDLVDHEGLPVTTEALRGRHVLLYFGFTYCPDICPTELGFLARVVRALGPVADNLPVYFVTVDPARDTAELLADYVPHFHPRFRALRGDDTAIAATTASLGVVAAKTTPAGAPEGFYLINHSMSIYHIGPDGRLIATYQSRDGIEPTVAAIRHHLETTSP